MCHRGVSTLLPASELCNFRVQGHVASPKIGSPCQEEDAQPAEAVREIEILSNIALAIRFAGSGTVRPDM